MKAQKTLLVQRLDLPDPSAAATQPLPAKLCFSRPSVTRVLSTPTFFGTTPPAKRRGSVVGRNMRDTSSGQYPRHRWQWKWSWSPRYWTPHYQKSRSQTPRSQCTGSSFLAWRRTLGQAFLGELPGCYSDPSTCFNGARLDEKRHKMRGKIGWFKSNQNGNSG